MCTAPNRSTAASASACTAPSSLTSVGKASTFGPRRLSRDPGRWRGADTLARVTTAAVSTLRFGESVELGRAARAEVPRSAHGDFTPVPDRPDPVAVLQAQAVTRVQELIPIRYGRMLMSPFTFYRGAAAVMAADLATTPDSGIVVQACGDAHISNFGGFAAPDRRLIFGPNDFDETLPRSVGVGRQADGGQRRDRRPRRRNPGGSPGAAGDCVRPRVPQGDARVRPGQPPRRVVRAHQRERAGRSLRRSAWPQGPDRVREAVREGASEDESAGGAQVNRAGRRRPSVSQRPAAARPGRRSARPRRPPR